MTPMTRTQAPLSADAVAQYRRQGYVVLPGLLSAREIAGCHADLSGLASGRIPPGETKLMYEAGIDRGTLAPDAREAAIRKYMDFVPAAPALRHAAMHRRLHGALDQLLGTGRVLFQEMALVKPAHIGSEKPWHQDAAYFRVTDPALIVGVWIALDPALKENGCMEVVPGSHLGGAVPHRHENDFNRCRILPSHVRADRRVAVEMQPGDALLFHSLLHHYTAANASPLRRRAVQFHYHQDGAEWAGVEEHRRLYHFADGSYAGCTLPHEPADASAYWYRGALARPVAVEEGA